MVGEAGGGGWCRSWVGLRWRLWLCWRWGRGRGRGVEGAGADEWVEGRGLRAGQGGAEEGEEGCCCCVDGDADVWIVGVCCEDVGRGLEDGVSEWEYGLVESSREESCQIRRALTWSCGSPSANWSRFASLAMGWMFDGDAADMSRISWTILPAGIDIGLLLGVEMYDPTLSKKQHRSSADFATKRALSVLALLLRFCRVREEVPLGRNSLPHPRPLRIQHLDPPTRQSWSPLREARRRLPWPPLLTPGSNRL